jgi:hypothetical protein
MTCESDYSGDLELPVCRMCLFDVLTVHSAEWKMGVGRVQRRQQRKQRWKLQVVAGDGILPPPTWCGGGAPPGPRNLDLFIRLPATRR